MRGVARVLIIAGLSACLSACPPPPEPQVPPPPPSPRNQFVSWLGAHNSNDVDGSLGFFAEDAVYRMADAREIVGRANIRDLEAWHARLNGRYEMSGIQVIGDIVQIESLTERNAWLSLLGIDHVDYQPGTQFVFKNARISEVRATGLMPESQRDIVMALHDFLAWAAAERPAARARLFDDGRFVYDAASATLWIELLRAWRGGPAETGSG